MKPKINYLTKHRTNICWKRFLKISISSKSFPLVVLTFLWNFLYANSKWLLQCVIDFKMKKLLHIQLSRYNIYLMLRENFLIDKFSLLKMSIKVCQIWAQTSFTHICVGNVNNYYTQAVKKVSVTECYENSFAFFLKNCITFHQIN